MTRKGKYTGYSHPSSHKILMHVEGYPDLTVRRKRVRGGDAAWHYLIDQLDGYRSNRKAQQVVDEIVAFMIDEREEAALR